jgi:hypothetical protein
VEDPQVDPGLLGRDVVQASGSGTAGLLDQPGEGPADLLGPPLGRVLFVQRREFPDDVLEPITGGASQSVLCSACRVIKCILFVSLASYLVVAVAAWLTSTVAVLCFAFDARGLHEMQSFFFVA